MALGPLAQAAPAPSPTQQAQSMGQRAAEMEQADQPLTGMAASTMQRVEEERRKLNAALERMIASRDRRMNLPFDPVLMQMAAGFLKPTKTGSFGESMGYAAEAGIGEAERQFARQQAEDKLQLELQQKLLESAQKQAGSQLLAGLGPSGFGGATLTGGAPAAPPAAGMPTLGAPAPGMPAPPAGGAAQQVNDAILGLRPITLDMLRAVKDQVDPETYKFLVEAMKAQQGERELQQKEAQPAKYNMEFIGEVSTTPDVYREYQRVLREVERTGNIELLTDFYGRRGLGQRKVAPAEPGAPGKLVSSLPLPPGEREVQQAGRIEFEKGEQSEAAKRASALIERGAQAYNTKILVQDARAYAESNPRVFDLLQEPGLKNQLIKAASDEGAQLGQFGSFTIPARTIAQYKLSKEDVEALQLFQARAAEITTQFRKTARAPGEGATTESEGRLFASLGLLATDSSRVIQLKAEFLEKRADFDEEVAKAYNKFRKTPGNSYNDFLVSDELKEIKSRYERDFKAMREANADLLRTAEKKQQPAGSQKPLADRIKEARDKQKTP